MSAKLTATERLRVRNQQQLAASLLEELEICGDVGEVGVLMILDALACAGLQLESARAEDAVQGVSVASAAFIIGCAEEAR